MNFVLGLDESSLGMSNTMYIFMKHSLYLKFRHYEKAKKFEKISHLF